MDSLARVVGFFTPRPLIIKAVFLVTPMLLFLACANDLIHHSFNVKCMKQTHPTRPEKILAYLWLMLMR